MSDQELIGAVKIGDFAAAEKLIKDGADVGQQDEKGWTPLNFAAGKGDLPMVKLLVENGADISKVGNDRRTPYLIALAAGRTAVVEYLGDMDERYGKGPARPERKYCKAYYLKDLRTFSGWREDRMNWKKKNGEADGEETQFSDEKVVFIHQDFQVTESMWEGENVIFSEVEAAWKDFCFNSLQFKVPTDMDLMVAADGDD